ncbi:MULTISPECIES: hypothetical protein [Chryseobacterium]|uniref:hypothetical protein n=1 Tax=Chryseobacterium TaxID=59732 RepID=UPI000678D935|nr:MULTISPECIES: hypothetical protein [Chryseobacterium]
MMKRLFFLYLGFLLSVIACQKKESSIAVPNDNISITKKINELYSLYGKSNEAIYNQPIADDLFTPDLKKIVENAINASKADIEKVKNSTHPDEKPLIFEGAIFSSLYEGYTGYKIRSIDMHNKTASAFVQFEYNQTTPKLLWTDKVHLINTDKGWRIDNIIFDTIGNSKDLKATLTDFAKSTHQ